MAPKQLILEWKPAKMMQPFLSFQKFATVAQVANFPDVPRPNSTELIPLKPRRTSCQRHGGQQPPPPTPPQDPVRSNFSERQPGNKIVTQVGEVP